MNFEKTPSTGKNWEGLSQQIRESYEKDDMIKKVVCLAD